ncbi:MAG: hypothetical protein ACI8S6_002574 [Myxococcota bacterium]|jgi:hypothetical protein
MLTMLALTLNGYAADDCVPEGDTIVIQDDLMRISADQADDIEIQVETMVTDDRVPWRNGEGEVIEADAAALEEGDLRRSYIVTEDHIMLRAGSSGLTINMEEYIFQIAGMGTEVLVFMTSDASFEDNLIFASTIVAGPLEAIEGEIPEGALQLIPSPTCE